MPFLLSAGKGLDERLCELRVRLIHLLPALTRPHPPSPALAGALQAAGVQPHAPRLQPVHPGCNRAQQVRFKPQPYNRMMGVDSANELVLRVQPDEALYVVAVAKTPGAHRTDHTLVSILPRPDAHRPHASTLPRSHKATLELIYLGMHPACGRAPPPLAKERWERRTANPNPDPDPNPAS